MISEALYAIVLNAVQETLGHPTFVANEAMGRKLLHAPEQAGGIVAAVLAQLPLEDQPSFNQVAMRHALRATLERVIVLLPQLEKQAQSTRQPVAEIIAKLVTQAGQPYLKKCA